MKPKEETLVQTASNLSKKVYIETYGCQMNFSDSEIVASVLTTNGYQLTNQSDDADLVLINTCSIEIMQSERSSIVSMTSKEEKRRALF